MALTSSKSYRLCLLALQRPTVIYGGDVRKPRHAHVLLSSRPAAGFLWKRASSGVSMAPCASSSSSMSSSSSLPSGSSPRSSAASTQTSPSCTKWSQSDSLFVSLLACGYLSVCSRCELMRLKPYSAAQASMRFMREWVKCSSFGNWKMDGKNVKVEGMFS